jgi:hypothetical protein
MIGRSHRYLSIFLWAATVTQSIFIVFCQHTSGKYFTLQFFCAAKNHGFSKRSH